ncbi:MAG: cysteine dioxygenase [Sphingobacterium sp.]
MEPKILALQKKLSQCTDYSEIFGHFMNAEIGLSDIKKYCTFSNDAYSRNIICKNEDYELVAICWAAGQYSDRHHHGKSSCAMLVLAGELLETTDVESKTEFTLIKTTILGNGSSIFLNNPMVWHQVRNNSNSQAISIHLYSPPL